MLFFKNGIRHQLLVSGMDRKMYWLSYLIGDLLMFVLPLIVLFICIAAINTKSLNMSASLFMVFVALILHVPGNVSFVYIFSFIFDISATILNTVSLFYNIITLNVVSYSVPESWGNSNLYFSIWFTVNFTGWVMPFFLSFLLDVRSALTDWNVSNFRYLF